MSLRTKARATEALPSGKVVDVVVRIGQREPAARAHRLVGLVAEIHAVEAGIVVAPGVERGDAVDAASEIGFGRVLEIEHELRIVAAGLGQEVRIGRLRQDFEFLLARLAGQIVARRVDELDQVAFRLVVERRVGHPFGRALGLDDQRIDAEHFLCERRRLRQGRGPRARLRRTSFRRSRGRCRHRRAPCSPAAKNSSASAAIPIRHSRGSSCRSTP